jgi:hypothetical protein
MKNVAFDFSLSPVLTINGSVQTVNEVNDGRSEFHYRDVATFLFPDLLSRAGRWSSVK